MTTVGDLIRTIKESCPPYTRERTCDQLYEGSADAPVSKIGLTFMADMGVLRRAIAEDVDFIITHEPTYHTAWDDTDWLQGDPVYEKKHALFQEHGIAVWRFHDLMHAHRPDLIYQGWEMELGWENCRMPGDDTGRCYVIPPVSLGELAGQLKDLLGIPSLRVIGNPHMICERVGVLVGGGSLGLGDEAMPAKLMRSNNLDLLLCGEITEWTICSYVRDAAAMGMNKAMIALGHNRTEEMGMKHLCGWLQPKVDVPVCFLPSGEPFVYL